MPTNIKNPPKFIGCLEIRYTPLVTGFSTGVETNARMDMMVKDIPSKYTKNPA
jgi:hypothetical protein